ncbi:MAG: hypothetical protein LBP38_03200 [Desulfovibrio sp.]|nr:hypothetical protein [Desulfovibrio sp.]
MLKKLFDYLGGRVIFAEIPKNAPAGNDDMWEEFMACFQNRPPISFWWRDDDVGGEGRNFLRRLLNEQRLGMMLALLAKYDIPAVFAITPYNLLPRGAGQVALLKKYSAYLAVHGISHKNNAGSDVSPSEFPDGCDVEASASAVLKHIRELADIFGDRLLPVFVPPWNNMDERLKEKLPACGITVVSAFNNAGTAGRSVWNADIDLIDWKIRNLRDPRDILRDIVRLLGNEEVRSIGMMNHYKLLGAKGAAFFDKLFCRTKQCPSVTWTLPGLL